MQPGRMRPTSNWRSWRHAAGAGRRRWTWPTRSLERNWRRHQARHLKIAILRRLGRVSQAAAEIQLALSLDRMEFGALWESNLLDGDPQFEQLAGGNAEILMAIALDYAHAGMWDEALALLDAIVTASPLRDYYRGWIYAQSGQREAAQAAFVAGRSPASRSLFSQPARRCAGIAGGNTR